MFVSQAEQAFRACATRLRAGLRRVGLLGGGALASVSVASDPVKSELTMATRAWKLVATLLAVATAACRAEVESETGWDLAAPDLLFTEGTAAYARGDWAGVVLSMERALRSRASLRALRLRCRTRCAADLPWELRPDSSPSLAQASGAAALHDLHFFGGLLHRAACLRRCLGPPAAHSLSEELELEFRKRSPYNYLQVAYFKVQTCVLLGGWDPEFRAWLEPSGRAGGHGKVASWSGRCPRTQGERELCPEVCLAWFA